MFKKILVESKKHVEIKKSNTEDRCWLAQIPISKIKLFINLVFIEIY